MPPDEIDSIEIAEQMIHENVAVILYLYNDNCAPCISLRPKVIKLLEDNYPEVKLYFINAEKYPPIAAHFNSFTNPAIILFFDGKEHKRMSKYVGVNQLSEEIKKPYFMIFEE